MDRHTTAWDGGEASHHGDNSNELVPSGLNEQHQELPVDVQAVPQLIIQQQRTRNGSVDEIPVLLPIVRLRNQNTLMSYMILGDHFPRVSLQTIEDIERNANIELDPVWQSFAERNRNRYREDPPAYVYDYLSNSTDRDTLLDILSPTSVEQYIQYADVCCLLNRLHRAKDFTRHIQNYDILQLYENDQLVQERIKNAIVELNSTDGAEYTICFLKLLNSIACNSNMLANLWDFAHYVGCDCVNMIAAVLFSPTSRELEQLRDKINRTNSDEVQMWETTARTILQYRVQQFTPEAHGSADFISSLKHMDPLTSFRLYQVHLKCLREKDEPDNELLALRRVLVCQALRSDEPTLANAFADYFARLDPPWTNEFGNIDNMNLVLALLASTTSVISACHYALQIGSYEGQEIVPLMALNKDALSRLRTTTMELFNHQIMWFSKNVITVLPHTGVKNIFMEIACFAADIVCHVLSSDMSAEDRMQYNNAIDTCLSPRCFNDTERTALKSMMQQSFNPDRRT